MVGIKFYGWNILREETLVWLKKVLSLLRECDKVRGGIRLGFRIRLGMLEMCKWMAFMRVGELVAKLG